MSRYGSVEGRRSHAESDAALDRSNASPTGLFSSSALPIWTKAALYLFGVVGNIPWNATILALPYLLDRLEGSPLQARLGSSVVVVFNVSGFIALSLSTNLANRIPPATGITFSICLIVLVLLVLATSPLWPTSSLFVAILIGTLILASANSFFSTSAITVATAFGPDMVAKYFSGFALVGLVGSAIVFVLACIPNRDGITDGSSGVVFTFLCGAAITLSSVIAFNSVVRNTETYKANFKDTRDLHGERGQLLPAQSDAVPQTDDGFWATTKRNWMQNLAQVWLWIVTLAVFPAVTTNIVPASISWSHLLFRTFHLLVFTIGDFVSRTIVSIYEVPTSPRQLLAYSMLQTMLAPLFFLCNLEIRTSEPIFSEPSLHSTPPSLIIGDLGFLTLSFLFSFLSGYAGSLGYVSVGQGSGEKARSGARVLLFWMCVGYVLGGAVSFWIEWWL